MPERYNTLRESPADAKFKLCVVQFKVPGAKNGGSDKVSWIGRRKLPDRVCLTRGQTCAPIRPSL